MFEKSLLGAHNMKEFQFDFELYRYISIVMSCQELLVCCAARSMLSAVLSADDLDPTIAVLLYLLMIHGTSPGSSALFSIVRAVHCTQGFVPTRPVFPFRVRNDAMLVRH